MADGSSPGSSGQRSVTVIFWASILATVLLSSRLTKTLPAPSAAANSGLPPRSMVPSTLPSAASMTVAVPSRPLKAKTRLLDRS